MGHAIGIGDDPTGAGLLEPPPDIVLAGPFDHAAPDRTTCRQSLGVVESPRLWTQVGGQCLQRLSLDGADRNRLGLVDDSPDAPPPLGQQRVASLIAPTLGGRRAFAEQA